MQSAGQPIRTRQRHDDDDDDDDDGGRTASKDPPRPSARMGNRRWVGGEAGEASGWVDVPSFAFHEAPVVAVNPPPPPPPPPPPLRTTTITTQPTLSAARFTPNGIARLDRPPRQTRPSPRPAECRTRAFLSFPPLTGRQVGRHHEPTNHHTRASLTHSLCLYPLAWTTQPRAARTAAA
jgi:hypothetical protein